MTDTYISDDVDPIEVEGDALPDDEASETGQAEAEGTPTPSVLDINEFGDHMVTVKVDGEEFQVPLREAVAGHQRQADYTRNMQSLSPARALQAALQNNPEGTIELLQKTYGVQTANQMVADSASETDGETDWTADDPVAQRLNQFEQRFAEFERYQQDQLLNSTLGGLQDKYGDDFDANEVIAAAVERQIDNPAALESVFRDLMFDKFYAQAQARTEYDTQRTAEDAAREAAKASVGEVVEQGTSVPGGSAASPERSSKSIAEAWHAAKAELGIA